MTEFLLIIFAAGLIYYVATRVAPHGLIFKLKKEEESLKQKPQAKVANQTVEEDPLLKEGQEAFNQGSLEKAEKKFLAALKSDPKAKEAYHFLGMIYLRQELYKGAIATLEKAIELDPLNDTDFNNLGLAYFNTKNYKKAIECLEKSISLNDKIAHRHLNLALAYEKEKDLDRAAIYLENAVRIHPNKEAVTLLAKNYIAMKERKLAEKALGQLLEIDPDDSWGKRQLTTLKN